MSTLTGPDATILLIYLERRSPPRNSGLCSLTAAGTPRLAPQLFYAICSFLIVNDLFDGVESDIKIQVNLNNKKDLLI